MSLFTRICNKHCPLMNRLLHFQMLHLFFKALIHELLTTYNVSASEISSLSISSLLEKRLTVNLLPNVFKTFWMTRNCYAEEDLKTSSRYVLKLSWRRHGDKQLFAGLYFITSTKLQDINLTTAFSIKQNVLF